MTTSMHEGFDTKCARIQAWISAHARDGVAVGLDDDLIEQRVLDSLRIMAFIAFLEELTEREIAVNASSVSRLRSLRSIYSHFLKGEDHGSTV